MYIIVECDGYIRSAIDVRGQANKYGEPKKFKTKKDAQAWIKKHSYGGMSFHYEIMKEVLPDGQL